MRELRRLAEPDHLGDRLHLLLDEDAVRIAVGVLLDRQRRRGRHRVAGDAGTLERFGVGAGYDRQRAAPESPDRADINRIVRSRGVELLAGRPALFRQDVGHVEIVGRIADRHGDDPVARLLAARQLGNPLLNVLDRAHRPKRWEHVAQRLAIHMRVAVVQARNDGPAVEVAHAGRRRGVRGHAGIGADRNDAIAGNRDRLCDHRLAVDRDDLAVLEDEVSRTRGRGLRGGGQTPSWRQACGGGCARCAFEKMPTQYSLGRHGRRSHIERTSIAGEPRRGHGRRGDRRSVRDRQCAAIFANRDATFSRCTVSPARWLQMKPSRTSFSACRRTGAPAPA